MRRLAVDVAQRCDELLPGREQSLVADVLDPHSSRPGHSIAVQLQAYLGRGHTADLEQQLRQALTTARPAPGSAARRTQPLDVARGRS